MLDGHTGHQTWMAVKVVQGPGCMAGQPLTRGEQDSIRSHITPQSLYIFAEKSHLILQTRVQNTEYRIQSTETDCST